jgi:putative membrane protein
MMGHGDFGSMGGFGWVWMVLLLAVVIALVVWGAGSVSGFRGGSSEPTPMDILRRRYAAGEITADEFEQAKLAIA